MLRLQHVPYIIRGELSTKIVYHINSTTMYDTVRFYHRDYRIDFNALIQNLTKYETKMDSKTGEVLYHEGYINNFFVRIGIGWIYCDCSFPRLIYSDNSFTLKRTDAKNCIEFLSDNLHYDMNNASVTRIDVATTFSMEQPVRMYLDCLGDLSSFKRLKVVNNETLEYRKGDSNNGQSLVFYDKRLESLEKRKIHPKGLSGDNLLRYEHRWHGRLATRLKEPEVIGSTLHDERFYQKIVGLWGEDYFKIEKKRSVSMRAIMQSGKMSNNEILNIIFAYCSSKLPHEDFYKFVNHLIDSLGLSANEKYRLMKKIKETLGNPAITEDVSLIKELDAKIREVTNNLQ